MKTLDKLVFSGCLAFISATSVAILGSNGAFGIKNESIVYQSTHQKNKVEIVKVEYNYSMIPEPTYHIRFNGEEKSSLKSGEIKTDDGKIITLIPHSKEGYKIRSIK